MKITIPSHIQAGQNTIERYKRGERTRTYQLKIGYWEHGYFHETDSIISTWESYDVVGPMFRTVKLLLELATDTQTDIVIHLEDLYELSSYTKRIHQRESHCYEKLFYHTEKILSKTHPHVAAFFHQEQQTKYFDHQNLIFKNLIPVHSTHKVLFDFKHTQNYSLCCFYSQSIQKYGNSQLMERFSPFREYKKQILFKQLHDNGTQDDLKAFYENHPGVRMKKLF